MNWKSAFAEGKELVVSTCSRRAAPNANIVISLGFIDGKLLVADCQMRTTIRNLKENSKVCVISKHYRIKGVSKVFSKGKYFDICRKKAKPYETKHAVLIIPRDIFDLDKVKKIF
jgi:hypothetical protein